MPCIEKPRTSPSQSWQGYCGKMLCVSKPRFRDIEDAQKGDKPICPQCRKVLGLDKKIIETRITSSFISISDSSITLYYNNKDKAVINLDFSKTKGLSFSNHSTLLNDEEIEYVGYQIKRENSDYAKNSIKHLKFEEKDILLLDKLIISDSTTDEEKTRLSEINNKLSLFILKYK